MIQFEKRCWRTMKGRVPEGRMFRDDFAKAELN